MLNAFWAAIAEQLKELRSAQSADDVLRILAYDSTSADAFFAGSGGDETVVSSLGTAGWTTIWEESPLYYVMRAPDGSVITYIEGDIYRGDHSPKNPEQNDQPDN